MSTDWDSYLCEVDGKPASILVELGLASSAPIAALPRMGYIHIMLHLPDENGFPTRKEYQVLTAIEDDLEFALSEHNDAVYAGRCATDGRYELTFYTTATNAWKEKVLAVMRAFPSYIWEAGMHDEPGWQTYLNFLYPAQPDLLLIQNRRVTLQMQKEGDSLESIRTINHWSDFSGQSSADNFCAEARGQGYAVQEIALAAAPSPSSSAGPSGSLSEASGNSAPPPLHRVHLSRADSLTEIDEITVALFELALSHNGSYAGWSCAPMPRGKQR